jgi:hypothetical protein
MTDAIIMELSFATGVTSDETSDLLFNADGKHYYSSDPGPAPAPGGEPFKTTPLFTNTNEDDHNKRPIEKNFILFKVLVESVLLKLREAFITEAAADASFTAVSNDPTTTEHDTLPPGAAFDRWATTTWRPADGVEHPLESPLFFFLSNADAEMLDGENTWQNSFGRTLQRALSKSFGMAINAPPDEALGDEGGADPADGEHWADGNVSARNDGVEATPPGHNFADDGGRYAGIFFTDAAAVEGIPVTGELNERVITLDNVDANTTWGAGDVPPMFDAPGDNTAGALSIGSDFFNINGATEVSPFVLGNARYVQILKHQRGSTKFAALTKFEYDETIYVESLNDLVQKFRAATVTTVEDVDGNDVYTVSNAALTQTEQTSSDSIGMDNVDVLSDVTYAKHNPWSISDWTRRILDMETTPKLISLSPPNPPSSEQGRGYMGPWNSALKYYSNATESIDNGRINSFAEDAPPPVIINQQYEAAAVAAIVATKTYLEALIEYLQWALAAAAQAVTTNPVLAEEFASNGVTQETFLAAKEMLSNLNAGQYYSDRTAPEGIEELLEVLPDGDVLTKDVERQARHATWVRLDEINRAFDDIQVVDGAGPNQRRLFPADRQLEREGSPGQPASLVDAGAWDSRYKGDLLEHFLRALTGDVTRDDYNTETETPTSVEMTGYFISSSTQGLATKLGGGNEGGYSLGVKTRDYTLVGVPGHKITFEMNAVLNLTFLGAITSGTRLAGNTNAPTASAAFTGAVA